MADQPRLLVVDDEEAICEGCRRILTRQGFDVDKTSDPCEGLDRATADDYAAILLDIKMPEMTGLDFLSKLRTKRQDTPVILMTGFPSVPTAVSAISLGAAGYVTKPFTPEEITQAVHRFATQPSNVLSGAVEPAQEVKAGGLQYKFWHESWLSKTADAEYRSGAVVAALRDAEVEQVRLPGIGEVVYQGLPLACVITRDGESHVIPAPLTGVVENVNTLLTKQPQLLAKDPCGQAWLADICATRVDQELSNCITRGVVVLAADAGIAEQHAARLSAWGCEVRSYVGPGSGRGWEDLTERLATHRDDVILLDAASLGEEGPKMAAHMNVVAPSAKIVVAASPQCPWEAAYRSARIFYYAVAAFEDNEIIEVLESAFAMPVVRRGRTSRSGSSERVAQINITNRNGEDVTLIATSNMLFRNSGLGAEIRGLVYDRLYPVQTIPGKSSVASRDILNIAQKCDRVIVLESKDVGRLPGRSSATRAANSP